MVNGTRVIQNVYTSGYTFYLKHITAQIFLKIYLQIFISKYIFQNIFSIFYIFKLLFIEPKILNNFYQCLTTLSIWPKKIFFLFLTTLLMGTKNINSSTFHEFLKLILMEPRNLNSFYRFLTTILIGPKCLNSFISISSTATYWNKKCWHFFY